MREKSENKPLSEAEKEAIKKKIKEKMEKIKKQKMVTFNFCCDDYLCVSNPPCDTDITCVPP